jgi:archaellum component FlaC
MNHSNEQSRNSPMGDLSKVTQNYILMGDIMTEIRNTIGKLSANSHDVGEAWKNFQSQIDSLNRNQKDKLYAARGIVSTCFRTVSTQMAQIQIDLNNHLRNISNTIGGQ